MALAGGLADTPLLVDGIPENLNLEAFEVRAIREALKRVNGNQNQAADLLCISRFAIKRRMDRYGIS